MNKSLTVEERTTMTSDDKHVTRHKRRTAIRLSNRLYSPRSRLDRALPRTLSTRLMALS